jgi:hypothetical protein
LFLFYEIYCAWSYSGMHSFPLFPGLYRLYCKWVIDSGCVGLPGYSDWISFSAHPTLFLINLAVSILITIVFAPLLALGFWRWRAQQRNLQRRESLPPLDTSIRESIDR